MNQVHQNRNDHVVEDTCDEIDFLHPYEYANETDEMDDYERGYDDEAVPADFTDITEIEQCAAADVPVVILLPDGTQVNHLNEVVNVVVEDVQQCENESSSEDNNAVDTNTEARRKVVERRTSDVCRAIQNLSMDEKRKVLECSLMKETDNCIEEITYMNNDTLFEGKLCAGVLEYFCKLQKKKKYKELYVIINDMFPNVMKSFCTE